jgi:hypothetical protein
MSIQRVSAPKKWSQLFDERVEYKLQTKTYRISNQKHVSGGKSPRKLSGELQQLTLPPINQAGSSSFLSPGYGKNSPKTALQLEDSVSVLTDTSSLSPDHPRHSVSHPSKQHRQRNSGGPSALVEGDLLQASSSLYHPSTSLELSMFTFRECKHTADNLVPPPKQLDWNVAWGSQLLCYLCNEPAINDCTICKKCNSVVHHLCLAEAIQKEGLGGVGIGPGGRTIAGGGLRPLKMLTRQSSVSSFHNLTANHKCPNCEETYQADMKYYEKLILHLKEQRKQQLSATLIGYRALMFLEKCRVKKKKKHLIKIQAIVRGVLTRKKIQQNVLSKIQKLILLQFFHFPSFIMKAAMEGETNSNNNNNDIIIIISTHDTFRNCQMFRFDKTPSNIFHDIIMIPGMAWNHTLLVTLGIRENMTGTYSLVGQAQLSVRDISRKTKRSDITLNFLERIAVRFFLSVVLTLSYIFFSLFFVL